MRYINLHLHYITNLHYITYSAEQVRNSTGVSLRFAQRPAGDLNRTYIHLHATVPSNKSQQGVLMRNT